MIEPQQPCQNFAISARFRLWLFCISVQHYARFIRLKVEVRMKDEKIPLYGVYLDVDGDRLRTTGV